MWTLALTEVVAYGVLYYSFAVFLEPVTVDLRASPVAVSAALSIALAVSALAAPAVGWWLDAHGARVLMACGSVLGAVSVLAWSQARTVPQLYLAFVGIGLASAAVLYEPAFAVINTWFDRDRRRALLALTVVAGFSSTIFLPLSQALNAAWGWRDALIVLAAALAVCAVPQAVLLRRRPADVGLLADGMTVDLSPPASAPGAAGVDPTTRDVTLRVVPGAAVRWLTVASVLETVATTVVAVYLVAYLTASGASPAVAAVTAGAIGVAQVAGRIVLTTVADRLGLAPLAAGMVAGQAAGVTLLLLLPAPASYVAFVVLFGAGFGVMSITRPALLGNYVDPDVFAGVSGRQTLVATGARVAAPVTAGAVIGVAGYGAVFVAVGGCALLAGAALLLAERSAVSTLASR